MNLTPTQLAQAAARIGIAEPNPLQQKVWNSTARRLVVLSPTGTGKTLAFAGALLRRLDAPGAGVQAVVLAPSRELAIQISEVLRRFAPDYRTAAFYGNHAMASEVGSLGGGSGPDIVVATPGRLLDHLKRHTMEAATVHTLVIDEYDKCLELGFHDEMSRIVKRLQRLRQVILTSATAAAELPDFIDMSGAETIDFCASAGASRIHTARVESPDRDKLDTLEQLLLSLDPGERVIVFVNHRESAERVFDRLRRDGFAAGLYHGGLEQDERERAVICLDNDTTPILVATDLAGRGLDIEAVGSVVHYHMPPTPQTWTHRNGRTARIDAHGKVYIITGPEESLPDHVTWDHDFHPSPRTDRPERALRATFHINAGRKEKVSRGDIMGFLAKDGGIAPQAIGKIDLRDHAAYVAVDRSAIPAMSALQQPRIKNKRVKITRLKK